MSKRYHLHRISHCWEWSHPLLKEGELLSIGWSEFATRDFIKQHQTDNWEEVPSYIEQKWNGWRRGAYSLQRFLRMKTGDWVIVPDWGTFHVYEVKSDRCLIPKDIENRELKPVALTKRGTETKAEVREGKLCGVEKDDDPIDLGFFQEVSRIEGIENGISRSDYADAALTSRLKARQTNLDITDLAKNICNAVKCFREKKKINLRNLVMEECAKDVLGIITKDLEPNKFEELIRDFFLRLGAQAEIPAKNEPDKRGDADIIATFETLKIIIYVQAKHYTGSAGKQAVEQIDEYVNYKNNQDAGTVNSDDGYTQIPWVITSAEEFTEECEERARSAQVKLVNGPEFAEMLLDAGIGILP